MGVSALVEVANAPLGWAYYCRGLRGEERKGRGNRSTAAPASFLSSSPRASSMQEAATNFPNHSPLGRWYLDLEAKKPLLSEFCGENSLSTFLIVTAASFLLFLRDRTFFPFFTHAQVSLLCTSSKALGAAERKTTTMMILVTVNWQNYVSEL